MERRVEQNAECDAKHESDPREHALLELILDACDQSEDAMEIGDWIEDRVATRLRTHLHNDYIGEELGCRPSSSWLPTDEDTSETSSRNDM